MVASIMPDETDWDNFVKNGLEKLQNWIMLVGLRCR